MARWRCADAVSRLEQADIKRRRKKKRTDTYPDLPLSSYRPENCPAQSHQALLEAHSHSETVCLRPAEGGGGRERDREREGWENGGWVQTDVGGN